MKTIKEELGKITATGSAGAGLVEATVSGEFQVLSINISDAAYELNDKTALQVLIVSALNDAMAKVKEATEAKSRDIIQNIERK